MVVQSVKIFPQRLARVQLRRIHTRLGSGCGNGVEHLLRESRGTLEEIEPDRDRQIVFVSQRREQSGLKE